jgi:hypothetical protein
MTKADRVHSTPRTDSPPISEGLNRRCMLVSLAALPAAVPAVAVAASAVNTDAELIALGKKFEILIPAGFCCDDRGILARPVRASLTGIRVGVSGGAEVVLSAVRIGRHIGLHNGAVACGVARGCMRVRIGGLDP